MCCRYSPSQSMGEVWREVRQEGWGSHPPPTPSHTDTPPHQLPTLVRYRHASSPAAYTRQVQTRLPTSCLHYTGTDTPLHQLPTLVRYRHATPLQLPTLVRYSSQLNLASDSSASGGLSTCGNNVFNAVPSLFGVLLLWLQPYIYYGTFRRLLTDFKGTVRWNKVLGCVWIPKSNNLNVLTLGC